MLPLRYRVSYRYDAPIQDMPNHGKSPTNF
jgi:hypothetical protein